MFRNLIACLAALSVVCPGFAAEREAPKRARKTEKTDSAAIVNGEAIPRFEVEKAFRRLSISRRDLTEQERELYFGHVLGMLIDSKLLNEHMQTLDIQVDEAIVDEHIGKFKQKLAKEGKTLETMLAETGLTLDAMRDEIRGVYRWLQYVERQANELVLKTYFDANKEAFDGTQVRARHILKRVSANASAEQRAAARKAIEAIRSQLAAGTNFESAARIHSDCPSKDLGGDLNFFPRKGVMSDSFAAVAFMLPKGQVSEVVETEFGYHLIVVTDRRSGKKTTYADVAEQVKNAYADDLRVALVSRLRQSAEITILR